MTSSGHTPAVSLYGIHDRWTHTPAVSLTNTLRALCDDQVDVEIPRELSDEQRELITELKKERDAHANDGKGGFFSSLGL